MLGRGCQIFVALCTSTKGYNMLQLLIWGSKTSEKQFTTTESTNEACVCLCKHIYTEERTKDEINGNTENCSGMKQ
jgi:hypothetical protein